MFELLLILFLLQVKHFYADFVMQTYVQTVRKGIYFDLVGISHSLDHIACSLLVLFGASFFITLPVASIIVLCLIEGIIHYHIDWFKVHYGIKDNTKSRFWTEFGMDQLAHQLTYIGMLYILLN